MYKHMFIYIFIYIYSLVCFSDTPYSYLEKTRTTYTPSAAPTLYCTLH